jgi:glycosyltransferase involved in cell wall biosynthesis
MRILIFHGYMLRGTGSNIYNVNLAPALARLGHEVHLLCQDREVKIPGVQIHNPDIGIDLALANHEVMGPAILARAEVAPFAVKVHGSALEYTVKPFPRFLPYAYEGMDAASGILVGSLHTAESLWTALPDLPNLKDKTRLGPPGVDVEEFRPLEDVPWTGRADGPSTSPRAGSSALPVGKAVPREAKVVFVGKLIVSKGVDLLLAAWPLLHAEHPGVRLQVAGFGAYEDGLRRLQAALDRGDLDDARAVATAGWSLEGKEEKPLPILSAFLADPPPGYAALARAAAGSVEWLGRLEHDEVAALLPQAEAVVMSSTFPEAFGMVAVEAAACGALPLSAGHSGMREVSQRLAAALPDAVAPLTSFPVEPGAVEAIADRLDRWFELPEMTRAEARATLVETVARLWSWEGVARGVLDAAAGNLGGLPVPTR